MSGEIHGPLLGSRPVAAVGHGNLGLSRNGTALWGHKVQC